MIYYSRLNRQGELMFSWDISRKIKWRGKLTRRVKDVLRMFGLRVDMLSKGWLHLQCYLELNRGDIVYITGPSGSGKSVLLSEMEKEVSAGRKVRLGDIRLEGDVSLVDCFEGDLYSVLKILSIAGLNDVYTIINQPVNLSDGQKYRYRLAKALASGRQFIFADEFCSNLDSITASTVSFQIHKFARKNKLNLILAGTRDDILSDLLPDVIVSLDLTGNTEVTYRRRR